MPKSRKKKLLLISDSHTHVIINAYRMLAKKFNVHFYCANHLKDQLDRKCRNNAKFFNHSEGMIYFFLIFKSFNYDYIYISTGPQNTNHKSGPIVLFFYIIFIYIYGHKTIMGIRENTPYYLGIHNNLIDKFQNFIRNKSISKINLLFFETKTLMKNFKKKFLKINPNSFVNYPLHLSKISDLKFDPNSKPIRIGILGSLSFKRKNYKIVLQVLKKLKKKQRENITIVMLGRYREDQNLFILKLREIVNVVSQKTWIEQDKFEMLAFSCHFLFSPLKKGFGGGQKGTGSLFDAIAAQKHLVIPYHADPELEFKDFCHYYTDVNSLTKVINKLLHNIQNDQLILNKKLFNTYNNDLIIKDLAKYLK